MNQIDGSTPEQSPTDAAGGLRLSNWIWHPWYAKLWWIAIPIYWAPAGGPTRIAAIAEFYSSGHAVATNIIFLPVTAGLVLGFGYLRRLFAEGDPAPYLYDYDVGDYRKPGAPHRSVDEFDLGSGPLWIGNRARNRVFEEHRRNFR
ncbi:hypothetical protein [Sphingomonas koreensis]